MKNRLKKEIRGTYWKEGQSCEPAVVARCERKVESARGDKNPSAAQRVSPRVVAERIASERKSAQCIIPMQRQVGAFDCPVHEIHLVYVPSECGHDADMGRVLDLKVSTE